MSPRRVYLVWALLALGIAFLLVAVAARWYAFEADAPDAGIGGQDQDIEPPRFQMHTDFWVDAHVQTETFGGSSGGADRFPTVAQVTETFRLFYLVGLVGGAVATVGLLFRMRGLPERGGLVATLAVFSLAALIFAIVLFSAQIPDAYERTLENTRGARPDLALFTFGQDDPDSVWPNADSHPGLGWYAAILGTAALAAAFVITYLSDLRRMSAVLTDDEAAAVQYERATRQRGAVGVQRFRQEGKR